MGVLRIIAGEHRGRRIHVPAGAAVRPTSDRARESLFNILGPDVPGSRVLDAYAGSGALGFEALSRGARGAVFIESSAGAVETLRANAEILGVGDRCAFHRGEVLAVLGRGDLVGPFDLVFADPPYDSEETGPFLEQIARFLDPARGRLVVERDRRGDPAPCEALEHVRTAVYGRCALDFYRPGGSGRLG